MKSFTATFVFLFLTSLVLRASSDDYNPSFFDCLVQFSSPSSSIFEDIFVSNNASYNSIYQTFANLRPGASSSRVRPLLILIPHDESEIQTAVHCSKKLGVEIRVRSGGHDYEGLSYTSALGPFVMIDMRNLRSISVDTKENTAWVQTGATLGEMYYTIAQRSKTLAYPAGTCPTVGVGGHFSGGGYGMMSRKHGLSIDHIIDATVIDANGRILNRRSMGEDLFWAIRGGGGTSFGIVIAFKVNLVVIPETITVFNVSRTSEEQATQLIHKWQYVSNKIDDNLLVRLFITSMTSPTNGNRMIKAEFISLYLGRATDLLSLMQEKFPELGLVEEDCIEMSWIESAVIFADHSDNSPLEFLLSRNQTITGYAKGKSDYVTTPISEHGLRGMWEFLHQEEERSASIQFSPYGGKLDTIAESATPFPHRAGNLYMIHYIVGWSGNGSSTESEKHINWIQTLYSYMEPYVSKSPRRAYFNYRDLDIGKNNQGDTSYGTSSVWGFKYFKNNFNRLVRIKTNVDPLNLFRNEQSIPPMISGSTRVLRPTTSTHRSSAL